MAKTEFSIPQEMPFIPGYYYSSEKLNSAADISKRGGYIGTEYVAGAADNAEDHRYVYYIVSMANKPVLKEEYMVPMKGYVYVLYTSSSVFGTTGNINNTTMLAPAGYLAYFAKVDGALKINIVKYGDKPVFCQSCPSGTVQVNVPKKDANGDYTQYFDLRSWISSKTFDGGHGYNGKLSKILQNKSLGNSNETIDYWENIYSDWELEDAPQFNLLKGSGSFTTMSAIKADVWNTWRSEGTTFMRPPNEDGQRAGENTNWNNMSGTRFCVYEWRKNTYSLTAGGSNLPTHIVVNDATDFIRSRQHVIDCYKSEVGGNSYILAKQHSLLSDSGFTNVSQNTINLNQLNDVNVGGAVRTGTWSDLEKLTLMFRYFIGRIVAQDGANSLRQLRFNEELGWNLPYYNFSCEIRGYKHWYINGTGNNTTAASTTNNGQTMWDAGTWTFNINTTDYAIFGKITLTVGDFRADGVSETSHDSDPYPYLYVSGSVSTPAIGDRITLSNSNLSCIVPNINIISLSATALARGSRATYSITKASNKDLTITSENNASLLRVVQMTDQNGAAMTLSSGNQSNKYPTADLLQPDWWPTLINFTDKTLEGFSNYIGSDIKPWDVFIKDWSFDTYLKYLNIIDLYAMYSHYKEEGMELPYIEPIEL